MDARLLGIAEAIARSPDYKVVFALDENSASIDVGCFEKIVSSRDKLRSIGLYADLDDVFWRCGDYPLYLARDAYPEHAFIWQFEYDVVINSVDPAAFLGRIDALSDADFMASHLRRPEDWWRFRHAVADRYPDVWRCYFPIVRLSGAALEFLHCRRVEDTLRHRSLPDGVASEWPNDEAFVATELMNNGYACADLNEVMPCYTDDTLWYSVLKHPTEITVADEMIYHAVRTGNEYARLIDPGTWINPLPSPAGYWSMAAEDTLPDTLQRALGELLRRHLERRGDDPLALFATGSPLSALLVVSDRDPLAAAAILHALANERMSFTLAWARRRREVFGRAALKPLDNLALAMPAWQSSTSPWSCRSGRNGDAAGGNDGQLNIEYGFHTDAANQSFWAVDLLNIYRIAEVLIFNRSSYYHRLEGFLILVSLDGFSWEIVHRNDKEADPVGPRADDDPIRVNLNQFGRFVRVQLPCDESLHLREVEVYGALV